MPGLFAQPHDLLTAEVQSVVGIAAVVPLGVVAIPVYFRVVVWPGLRCFERSDAIRAHCCTAFALVLHDAHKQVQSVCALAPWDAVHAYR